MKFKRSYEIRGSRGLTLAEVLIALTIFSFLMVAIFGSFKMGLNAFHKTSTKNDLHRQAQVLSLRLLDELQRSSISSVSLDPPPPPPPGSDKLCFLSALDPDGNFMLDPRGRPDWQNYVIYYHNSSDNTVYRKEVPLITTASQKRVPTPIENYNPGSGEESLSFYATGGQPVGRFITKFEISIQPAPVSQVVWEIEVERARYGLDSSTPEKLTGKGSAYLRN